jgi:hypothetical protein
LPPIRTSAFRIRISVRDRIPRSRQLSHPLGANGSLKNPENPLSWWFGSNAGGGHTACIIRRRKIPAIAQSATWSI